jgi:hypothetical protein
MSAETEHTSTNACDQLLDYAYDELAADARAAFEKHLVGCAKCQAELTSIQRVRGAVKKVLPAVEPPANATGALHAQLLHAAAQRSAGGGKVLPFSRKLQRVMSSPAFLAAAMFALVGGAAGTMWWHGKIDMPAKTAEAPAMTAPVQAQPMAAPAAEPGKLDEKNAEDKDEGAAKLQAVMGRSGGDAENTVYLGVKDGALAVKRPPAGPAAHASAKTAAPADVTTDLTTDRKIRADVPMKKVASPAAPIQAKPAFDDSSFGSRAAAKEEGGASVVGGTWNAQLPGAVPSPSPAPPPAVSSSAPASPPAAQAAPRREPMANKADEERSSSLSRANEPLSPPQGMLQAAPQTITPAPAQAYRNTSNEATKKRALALADSGRCEEALPILSGLMRDKTVSFTPRERLSYIKCLRESQRYQQAEDELDTLRRDKAVTNQMIDREEKLLKQSQTRAPAAEQQAQETRAKAKKAAKPSAAPPAEAAPAAAKPAL